jgi:hypothetical protein
LVAAAVLSEIRHLRVDDTKDRVCRPVAYSGRVSTLEWIVVLGGATLVANAGFVPNLRGVVDVLDCAHWTQQKRPDLVTAALLDLLRGLGRANDGLVRARTGRSGGSGPPAAHGSRPNNTRPWSRISW